MATAYDEILPSGGDTATPINLEKRIRFIEPYLQPGQTRFLDCGCGRGEYVYAIKDRFDVDAWGIEYLEDKVREAKAANPSQDRVLPGDIQNLSFPDASFDLILLNEVLEHVPSEELALAEICRVLRPDGTLIVFSPNRWFPFETHGVHLKKSGRYVKPYVPFIPYLPLSVGKKHFNYWARNYWQGEMQQLVEAAGLEIVKRGFIWQTFENISGNQPAVLRHSKKFLRFVAIVGEKTPFVKRFGTTQALVARKS